MDDGINLSMPVQPAYGGNGMNNGGFGFGGDWSWILLLVLLCGGGGFGFGGFGGGFGGFGGMYEFPWLLNGQQNVLNGVNANTNAGFNQAATQAALGDLSNALTSGFGNMQTALCGGFAGVNATVNGAQNAIAQQLYTNQIADMERSFAAQTQAADCCCKTQTNIADLKYTVATENCADRQALSDGIRDLLAATQAQTQTILTQMCNDKLEAKNDLIAQLRQQLNMADLRASQVAQTADIRANNATVANQLVAELRSCPIPAQPVYGNTPIFTCGGSSGCGCGNSFAN